MKTDVHEHDDHYEVDIDLPGFKKEEIKLELNNGYLTVGASKEHDQIRRCSSVVTLDGRRCTLPMMQKNTPGCQLQCVELVALGERNGCRWNRHTVPYVVDGNAVAGAVGVGHRQHTIFTCPQQFAGPIFVHQSVLTANGIVDIFHKLNGFKSFVLQMYAFPLRPASVYCLM